MGDGSKGKGSSFSIIFRHLLLANNCVKTIRETFRFWLLYRKMKALHYYFFILFLSR